MNTFNHILITGLLLSAFACLPAGAQMAPDPDQPDMVLNGAQRQQVIDAMIKELHKSYAFPEQAKKVAAAIRQHQKKGDYDAITSAEELSKTLTEHVFAHSRDKHLRVSYSAQPIPEQSKDKKPSADEQQQMLTAMKSNNFGVARVERLPFNIGYLNLFTFAPVKDAAQTLAAAMTLLAHTDAMIIDLRENDGGDQATVTLLASYLLDERTHMTNIYFREGDRTEQMWSSDVVQGARFGQKKDVYVLTSKTTFSAAEDFSYALKSLKRITVVGETTGGGAHPGDEMRLSQHFSMFVPNGRSLVPVNQTNWERVGVAPDISVTADDAFKTAQLAILKKLAATEKNPGKLERIKRRITRLDSENTASTMAR
ncbi:MAG: S41 family peptidase [Telluria sp.]